MSDQTTTASVKKGEHNPFANGLLEQAQSLIDEKADVFDRIGANRRMLRDIKSSGLLSKEQAKAIDAFYPKPKPGAKTEDVPAATTDGK